MATQEALDLLYTSVSGGETTLGPNELAQPNYLPILVDLDALPIARPILIVAGISYPALSQLGDAVTFDPAPGAVTSATLDVKSGAIQIATAALSAEDTVQLRYDFDETAIDTTPGASDQGQTTADQDATGHLTRGLLESGGEIPVNLRAQYRFTTRYHVLGPLQGKVRIQAEPNMDPDGGEFAMFLADELVRDVEAEVERRLGARYKVPLPATFGEFQQLPESTYRAIRALVDAEAQSRIIKRAHGRTGPSDGDDYVDPLHDEYEAGIAQLLDMGAAPLAGLVPLHSTHDDARPAGVVADARGFPTGVDQSRTDHHPVDSVLARLPRSDRGW